MTTRRSSKLIIIVLYKCTLKNSESFKSLLSCRNQLNNLDKIVIWDNSPVALDIEEINDLSNLKFSNFTYVSTPENLSLAKIYNDVIKSNLSHEFVILFDQDTEFRIDLFEQFEIAKSDNPHIALFAPLIRNNGIITSPGDFNYYNGKYWTSPKYGIIKSKHHIAITSGLIIKISAIELIGYFEERLLLYGIDTNFMIRYSRYFAEFFVLDVYIRHDMSDFNDENVEVKLRRFKDHKRSCLINAQLFSIDVRILTKLLFVYKSAFYAIKFRTLAFFS